MALKLKIDGVYILLFIFNQQKWFYVNFHFFFSQRLFVLFPSHDIFLDGCIYRVISRQAIATIDYCLLMAFHRV